MSTWSEYVGRRIVERLGLLFERVEDDGLQEHRTVVAVVNRIERLVDKLEGVVNDPVAAEAGLAEVAAMMVAARNGSLADEMPVPASGPESNLVVLPGMIVVEDGRLWLEGTPIAAGDRIELQPIHGDETPETAVFMEGRVEHGAHSGDRYGLTFWGTRYRYAGPLVPGWRARRVGPEGPLLDPSRDKGGSTGLAGLVDAARQVAERERS